MRRGRADGRDHVRPCRAAQAGRALAGVRRAHLQHAARQARVERSRGARRDAAHRPAQLAPRVRGARPARAQPAAGALVRRRHGRRERGAPRLARHSALGDAGARACHRGDAQPVRRPGRALAGVARRGRRAAVRPRRARRRACRAGQRRVRRLGGAEHVRRRGLGAGRPGRHEHADRELPRLSERRLGNGADPQGDAPGAPLRRRALELPPRGRAGRRDGGSRPGRPRRRPTRARARRS